MGSAASTYSDAVTKASDQELKVAAANLGAADKAKVSAALDRILADKEATKGATNGQNAGIRSFTHVDKKIEGKLPYVEFRRKMGAMTLEDLPKHRDIITQFVEKFKENWDRGLGSESFVEDTFNRSALKNCIFVGHANTDLDSIAGAICGAELFRGVPARSEESFNGEVACALKVVGMDPPPVFGSLAGGGVPDESGKFKKVCLVDHNEVDQMTPALKNDTNRMKRIVGLIDHHAVASSFFTSSPLFMDVRPWGSMCSIIFHNYLRNRVPIRPEIARLLLCAILSDTLNLRSGTTTAADRFSVALLASFGDVRDVDNLAMQLFTAKTDWIVNLGAYEMIRGDQKNFNVGEVRMSLAVLEVTTMEPVLAVAEDLLTQLRVFKYEKGDYFDEETEQKLHDPKKEVHVAMLFIVDTVKQCSVCLVCDRNEKHLAKAAFPAATFRAASSSVRSPSEAVSADETLCDLGALVSRKLEFLPMCTDALKADTPEWFTASSKDQERVRKVLQHESLAPTQNDGVRMIWDKQKLKTAVFKPDDAMLKNIFDDDE
eukprot:TRINITY_DN27815_c0_g1_i1.p1 TRINITY_DN27815_c0_g1~~TRINITY_DN27815_c0_g1_i1.p1  ORF type:complete len:569 (+),score=126.62 TRINITY_DN27815_c0_g1_i1:70-1707(+)